MPVSHAATISRRGAALWMVCGLAAPVWAQAVDPAAGPVAAAGDATPLRVFDIPSQPLAAALTRYSALTDQPAVFASALVAGRVSAAMRGSYSPEAGLRLLLQGTGLGFEKISSGLGSTFLLREDDTSVPDMTLTAFYQLQNYPGHLQARLRDALCADPVTMPGYYDTLFRFRLDHNGHVHDAVLLDSTGNARRDRALLAALQQVSVDAPPPSVREQPLTMRLRRSLHPENECVDRQMQQGQP